MVIYSYVDYINYSIPLWIGTGLVLLRMDVKGYAMLEMKKEKKVAGFLGWLNLIFGTLLFLGSWTFQKFIL